MDKSNVKPDTAEENISEHPLFEAALREYFRRVIMSGKLAPPPPAELRSSSTRPIHIDIVRIRKHLTVVAAGLVALCALALTYWLSGYCAPLAIISIFAGTTLPLLILMELLKGSGWFVEKQYRRGGESYRTSEFVPSIRTPRMFAFFIFLTYITIFVGYTTLYASIATSDLNAFSKTCDSFSALYFTIVTFATVGYGDYVPISISARAAVLTEIAVSIIVNTILLAMIISWVTSRISRQHEAELAARDREVQERELRIKKAKLGQYASSEETIREIRGIITELQNGSVSP